MAAENRKVMIRVGAKQLSKIQLLKAKLMADNGTKTTQDDLINQAIDEFVERMK